VIKAAFWSSFIALAIGGSLGLVQALHRTDVFRFLESPDYYTVLTAHGVLLAISFTIFFLVGVFTWAVTTSLDRGVEDIRFTWGWYAMMVVGTVLVGVTIFAGFLEEPPVVLGSELYADVLFTFYAPLQAHPFFYIGLVFVVGSWLASPGRLVPNVVGLAEREPRRTDPAPNVHGVDDDAVLVHLYAWRRAVDPRLLAAVVAGARRLRQSAVDQNAVLVLRTRRRLLLAHADVHPVVHDVAEVLRRQTVQRPARTRRLRAIPVALDAAGNPPPVSGSGHR